MSFPENLSKVHVDSICSKLQSQHPQPRWTAPLQQFGSYSSHLCDYFRFSLSCFDKFIQNLSKCGINLRSKPLLKILLTISDQFSNEFFIISQSISVGKYIVVPSTTILGIVIVISYC